MFLLVCVLFSVLHGRDVVEISTISCSVKETSLDFITTGLLYTFVEDVEFYSGDGPLQNVDKLEFSRFDKTSELTVTQVGKLELINVVEGDVSSCDQFKVPNFVRVVIQGQTCVSNFFKVFV